MFIPRALWNKKNGFGNFISAYGRPKRYDRMKG